MSVEPIRQDVAPRTAEASSRRQRTNSPQPTPQRGRLGLQARAPHNIRRHVFRNTRRFLVLLAGDLGTFWLLRALIRLVRDQAVFGNEVARLAELLSPRGILNGWQYASALFLGLWLTGNYGQGDQRRDPRRVLTACALATALPLWMTVWTRGLGVVAAQYSVTTLVVWLFLSGERRIIDWLVAKVLPPSRQAARTLLVGPAEDCVRAQGSTLFGAGSEFLVLGYVDIQVPSGPGSLGHISGLHEVLNGSHAEAVVVCGYLSEGRFQAVVDTALASGCQLLSIPRALEVAGVQPKVVYRRGVPLMELTTPNFRGQQLVLKRLLDLIGAAVGLVLASPIMLLAAILVKRDSSGPVFFTQERVGQGGRTFKIHKFRTMKVGAEQARDELLSKSVYQDPRLFKMVGDPRITRVGQWMRRSSVDELPQLWNVLKGEMSLVGPRPPLPSEVALYEAHHYARFDVKPGITGPWQVAGRNKITDFETIIGLETEYIREWTLLSDIAILLRTVWVVLQMQGAH